MSEILGVDIGGTKVAAARVAEDGAVRRRAVRPTPRGRGPEAVLEAVLAVATEVRAGDELACGVGCGGPMAPGGADVSPLNIPDWRRFPLRRRLQDALSLPVHVDNDAKALALGEGWCGAAAGERDYIALVVSTGVGGGIVLDGRLLDGRAGNAGHVGHVIVEPAGAPCACGARGCLEAEASGTAIAARTGRPPAEAGPEERTRCGTLVGRAVASVANLLDLRLAVVAGSVALGYGDDLLRPAQAELDARCRLDFSAGTRIRLAGLGSDGPLVGAAAVALRALGRLPGPSR